MAESAGKRSKASAAAEENGRVVESNDIARKMTDLDFLRSLIETVDNSGIDSLEIARGGTRIRIGKTPSGARAAYMPMPAMPPMPAFPAPQPPHVGGRVEATPGAPAPAAPAAAPAETKSNLTDVKSPMVGTFYRAPAPEAPPYVEVGTVVSKGQTLCILEAMKLMNELESEVDGVIREILIEDADPVEYGQVLFRIEPSGSK